MLIYLIFIFQITLSVGQYCCPTELAYEQSMVNYQEKIDQNLELLKTWGRSENSIQCPQANSYYGRFILNGYFGQYDDPLDLAGSLTVLYTPNVFEFHTPPWTQLKWDYITEMAVGVSASLYKLGLVTYGISAPISPPPEFPLYEALSPSTIALISMENMNYVDPDLMNTNPSVSVWPGGAKQKLILTSTANYVNSFNPFDIQSNAYAIGGENLVDLLGTEASNFSCIAPQEITIIVNITYILARSTASGNWETGTIVELAALGEMLDFSRWRTWSSIPFKSMVKNTDGVGYVVDTTCGGGANNFQGSFAPGTPYSGSCAVPVCINKKDISMKNIFKWATQTQEASTAAITSFNWPSVEYLAFSYYTGTSSRRPAPTNIKGDTLHPQMKPNVPQMDRVFSSQNEKAIVHGYLCKLGIAAPLAKFKVYLDDDYSIKSGLNELQIDYFKTELDMIYSKVNGRRAQYAHANSNWADFVDNINGVSGFYLTFQWDNGCIGKPTDNSPFIPQQFLTTYLEGFYFYKQ